MGKYTGYKVTIAREDDVTPGTYNEIGQVTNITPPQYSREVVDVTDRDSPNGYREHLAHLKDAGEVSIEINYDPSVHNSLLDDFEDDNPINYQISFPTDPVQTQTFGALITGFAPGAPQDGALTATITLKVSGKPTWA